ncbi:hypothetical protein HK098_004570 [Nowakowskiella sp. JEL0407]|nr:hypothetical protein HK098_004570 [Nowakowskiella sp. JEL0407]
MYEIPIFADNLLKTFQSCQTISNLSLDVPVKIVRRFNELLHSLPNLKSLVVFIASSELDRAITNKDKVYEVLSNSHGLKRFVRFWYDELENDFDLVCNLLAENIIIIKIILRALYNTDSSGQTKGEYLFRSIHDLWKVGDFTIAYVFTDSSEDAVLRGLQQRYENTAVGLILGNWAIWYKNHI